jgi:hypothetical protein
MYPTIFKKKKKKRKEISVVSPDQQGSQHWAALEELKAFFLESTALYKEPKKVESLSIFPSHFFFVCFPHLFLPTLISEDYIDTKLGNYSQLGFLKGPRA